MSGTDFAKRAIEDAILEQMLETQDWDERVGTVSGGDAPGEVLAAHGTDAEAERELRCALLWHTLESLAGRLGLDFVAIVARFNERNAEPPDGGGA